MTTNTELAEQLSILRKQAAEIASAGHNGWGNTMLQAADYIESHPPVDVYSAYETWPADIRAKISLHDLRRMSGWASKAPLSDWRIDTSAGRPILVYKDCSVIEGEDARYILGLIEHDQRPICCTADGNDWGGNPVAKTHPPVDAAVERDALVAAAEFASNVLAELYAIYGLKIGPFSTQAQLANVKLRAALTAQQQEIKS